MKVVYSATREYQLVAKTKKKDVDGVIYLVAGEKDLWVKLLNNKSAAMEQSVKAYIATGVGAMFDIPIEIVRDGSKFVGYSFRGQEMDVVPVKQSSSGQKTKTGSSASDDLVGFSEVETPRSTGKTFGGQKAEKVKPDGVTLLALAVEAVILFVLSLFWFNNLFLNWVYNRYSDVVYQGCALFTLHGGLAGAAGIVLAVIVLKEGMDRDKGMTQAEQMGVFLGMGLFAFVLGDFIGDMVILILVMAIVTVVGVIETYMAGIISAIVFVVMIGILIKWLKSIF